MIIFKTLSEPYYDMSIDRYCFEAKVGFDYEEMSDEIITFETENDAWNVYKTSMSQFEFMDADDIQAAIMRGRMDEQS